MNRLRNLILVIIICNGFSAFAQQPLPHGMIFGSKPDTGGAIHPAQLRQFMGDKKRVNIVLIARIAKVTSEKGGWFELEAGKKNIAAHFKDYNVTLPQDIKGRTVIIDAVAVRRLMAEDGQHFAGDTITYKSDTQLRRKVSLEVKGLMVYQ